MTFDFIVTSLVNHVLNTLVVKEIFAVVSLIVVLAKVLVLTGKRGDTEVSLGGVQVARGARQRDEFGLKGYELTKRIGTT